MTIGEFIQRKTRPNPDGGIGGLTPAEDDALNDLLNRADKLCDCGVCGCGSPLIEPKRFRT
jgi:hypothetical protein